MGKSAKILFGGKERRLNELSRLLGINRQTLRDRLDKGMTIQDAISYPKRSRTDSLIITTQDGQSKTMTEWARIIGISQRTLKHRIENWPPDQWLLHGKKRRYITAFGKTQTLSEWSREKGIDLRTLNSRLNRSKLTPELALTLPIEKRKPKKEAA